MSSIQEHFCWPTNTFYLFAGKDKPSYECKVYTFLGSTTTVNGERFELYRRIVRTFDGAQQTLVADIDFSAEDYKLRLYHNPECTQPANISASFHWEGAKLSITRATSGPAENAS